MLKDFVAKLIIFYLLLFILFPLPIFEISRYDFSTAYIALLSSFLLLPAVFFLSKSYWKNKVTIGLWCLRIFAAINFLLVTPRAGLTPRDIISFGGTISITFFYEMGYFMITTGYFKKFLQYWIWLSVIICIYLLMILLPMFLQYGPIGIMKRVNTIRIYHTAWPNHVGMYLVLLFWTVIYFSQQNKKYFLSLVFILPTLFLTFSRTAYVALCISTIFWILMERKKKSFVLNFLILGMVVLSGYSIFSLKNNSSEGENLYSAIASRYFIWETALSRCQEHPFLGYGFRSFVDIVPDSYSRGIFRKSRTSHNDYIDLLLRGGLLYSIAFWAFILFTVYKGLKSMNNEKHLLRYLSYCTIALLVSAFFQNPFKDPLILAYFWSYIAAIAYYTDKRLGFNGLTRRKPKKWVKMGGKQF